MGLVADEVRRLAEDPSAYAPFPPGAAERIVDPRYVVFLWGEHTHPQMNSVSRLRLAEDGVERAVVEVRALFAERGRPASTWEVGSSATPPDLVERLIALGMAPFEEEPLAVAMALVAPPRPGPDDVAVTKVETLEDYRKAVEIACEGFELDGAHRAEALAAAEREFRLVREHGSADTFLAWLDGEAVARATAVYTDAGVCLFGGTTLERARGRGAYRALVAARWEEAVRRGRPALVTQAGKMSQPILRRLGFEEVGQIRVLLDRPAP